MAKPPKIDADQLGAVIDAMSTINALMFTALATESQTDALLGLLDKARKSFEAGKEPTDPVRASVLEATIQSLQGLKLIGPVSGRSAVQ